jgi:hypothetical protein
MRLASFLAAAAVLAGPFQAQAVSAADDDGPAFPAAAVSDDDLAQATGKFTLPNGVELALAVTSDTVVNGQLILRTVFTIDNSAQLTVLGRESSTAGANYGSAGGGPGGMVPTGITVSLDRQSGIQTITPTYTVQQTSGVSIGPPAQDSDSLGLTKLPVMPDGPAVATVDGIVSVQTLANGSLVTLSGDRMSVSNLVGQSVATAVANSANDRTFDTVTNIAIDLRNVEPYVAGSAAMRVDSLALDATRGMIR